MTGTPQEIRMVQSSPDTEDEMIDLGTAPGHTALATLDHPARRSVVPQVFEELAAAHPRRHAAISGRASRLLLAGMFPDPTHRLPIPLGPTRHRVGSRSVRWT